MTRFSGKQLAAALLVAAVIGVVTALWDSINPLLRGVVVGVIALVAVLLVTIRQQPRQSPPDPLREITEGVLADETRRPWNPTTLPWLPTEAAPKPVLLVPAADYHLAEIVPLAQELNRRDIPTRIAIGESPWYRTWHGLSWYQDLEVFQLPDPGSVQRDISLVVTMKDTGSMTDWVTEVRSLRVPVVGKVEGAQDFWDGDTPEERRPYRNLDLVLCQGQFDADALADRDTVIVGSSRLERLWWAPPASAREPLALINLNFVYGVRTEDRRMWLETAITGCEAARVPYVISVHAAEKSPLVHPRATRISASRLLPHASVLISRFSTLPFEAMALGVPFVYHNPHGEKVNTFTNPDGAFQVSDSAVEVASFLGELPHPGSNVRNRAAHFFLMHVSTDPFKSAAQRAGDAIAPLLGKDRN